MTTEALNPSNLTAKEKAEWLRLQDEREKLHRENKLYFFRPAKWQLDFITATKTYQECAVFKANQIGGTAIMAFVFAVCATGVYDELEFEWPGVRFDGPITGLIAGWDMDQLRGGIQRLLFGEEKPYGTGPIDRAYPMLPYDICQKSKIQMSTENRGTVDYASIPHVSGDNSLIYFVTQKQDWGTIMGQEFDLIGDDEFPYNEGLYNQQIPRIAKRKGRIIIMATPEKREGKPICLKVLNRFRVDKPRTPTGKPLTWYREVSLYEAEHYTQEEKEAIHASYQPWEVPFRVFGRPVFGEGLLFQHKDEDISCQPDQLPEFDDCEHIIGLDWGMSDYGGLVWIMIDESTDIHYVWNIRKIKNINPEKVALIIREEDRRIGLKVPCVYGRDVSSKEATSSTSIMKMMRQEGVNMYPEPAWNAFTTDESNYILPGIYHINSLMRKGKFKVLDAPHMRDLWEELHTYYIKEDGTIPKKKEMRFDLVEGMRYGTIMARFAQSKRRLARSGKKAKTSFSLN